MTKEQPVCLGCQHFHMNPGTNSCDAFPTGIPALVWFQGHQHLEPIQHDQGLQFRPVSEQQLQQNIDQYGQARRQLVQDMLDGS